MVAHNLTVVLVASLLGANCDVFIAVSLYTSRSRVGFYRMKLHAIVISFRDVKCYKACLKAVVSGLRALVVQRPFTTVTYQPG